MNSILKALIPHKIRTEIRRRRSRFYGKTEQEVFAEIYQTGYWKNGPGGSVSGPGSSPEATQLLQTELKAFFRDQQIASLGDVGCGDFNWMAGLVKDIPSVRGYEIVPDLVGKLNAQNDQPNLEFICLNILEESPAPAEMMICRDCLVHFSLENIQLALKNLLPTATRFLALTHFPEVKHNEDIATGNWRPLNMTLAPFHLPPPDFFFTDIMEDKGLAIWKMETLSKQPV